MRRSIGELVQRNADYLVNAISLRLRHFCENKKSPLVLKVMLQYSSKDILPLINDAIQEVGVYHYLKWLLFQRMLIKRPKMNSILVVRFK